MEVLGNAVVVVKKAQCSFDLGLTYVKVKDEKLSDNILMKHN